MKTFYFNFLKLLTKKIKKINKPKMKLRGKDYKYNLNSEKFKNFYDLKCYLAELVTDGDFEARKDIDPKEIYPFCKYYDNTLHLSFFCTYENTVMRAEGKINIKSGDVTIEYEQYFDIELEQMKNIKDMKLLRLLNKSKNKMITKWEKEYIEYNDHKINKYIIGKLNPMIDKYLLELSKVPRGNLCLNGCPHKFKYELLGECEFVFCKGELYRYEFLSDYNNHLYIRIKQ